MALRALLAFWTDGDAIQMDRSFRKSGLMRPKCDRVHFSDGATYGERTIDRAIRATDEFYDGGEGQWQLFDKPNGTDSSVAIDQRDVSAAADGSVVSAAVVVELREQLDTLEAENERLRSELANERDRRQQLEADRDVTDDEDGSFLGCSVDCCFLMIPVARTQITGVRRRSRPIVGSWQPVSRSRSSAYMSSWLATFHRVVRREQRTQSI